MLSDRLQLCNGYLYLLYSVSAIKYKIILSQQQKDEPNVPSQNSTNSSSTTAATKPEKVKIKLLSSTVTEPEKKSKSQHHVANLRSNHNYNLERIFSKERHETEMKSAEKSDTKTKSTTPATTTETSTKKEGSDDWQTDEDDLDGDDDESITDSATNASSCSSPTPKSSPKHRPLIQKKHVKKLKKSTTALISNDKPPSVGEEVVTEALVVYSTATVVWQDGTIESGIPSTQLYPIHHLDDHVKLAMFC